MMMMIVMTMMIIVMMITIIIRLNNYYNLGHNWLGLSTPYRKFTYFYDKLHVEHFALLKPPLPLLSVELVSWYITKSCFGVFTTLNWGGEGETKFVLSMFNNFVILAGMVSRVLSKIVELQLCIC
jgi:hypothetical protein